MTSLVLEPEC